MGGKALGVVLLFLLVVPWFAPADFGQIQDQVEPAGVGEVVLPEPIIPGGDDVVVGWYLMRDKPELRRRLQVDVADAGWDVEVVESEWLQEIGWVRVKSNLPLAKAAVQGLEPDRWVYVSDTIPNDPYAQPGGQQYALGMMQLYSAWDVTQGSGDVVIAVIDTGVDATHPELAGKLVAGYDFVNRDNDPADDHGHGTHVSGIAAANTNNGVGVAGVCWYCKIMPLKALNSGGSGTHSAIAEAITYAVDHGAKVVNMSLGGYSPSGVLEDAVNRAASRAVIVAAAGNDGATTPQYPAGYPAVLSVCATDASDRIAGFSNRWLGITVCAPGVSVLSTVRGGGYQSWSGTSMSAPNVAGLAGLLMGDPAMQPGRVKAIIDQTADVSLANGFGRVNAARAVRGQVGPVPTSTPGAPTGTPRPTSTRWWTPVPTPTGVSDPVEWVEAEINQVRQQYGLAPLNVDARLRQAAQRQSDDQAAHGFCSHTGSDGSGAGERIADTGYQAVWWSEVICCGCNDAGGAVSAWMASASHRPILLDSNVRDIGAGYATSGSAWRLYWTVDFGLQAGSGETPTLQPTWTPVPTPTYTPRPTWTPRPGTSTPNPGATPTPTGNFGEVTIGGLTYSQALNLATLLRQAGIPVERGTYHVRFQCGGKVTCSP